MSSSGGGTGGGGTTQLEFNSAMTDFKVRNKMKYSVSKQQYRIVLLKMKKNLIALSANFSLY